MACARDGVCMVDVRRAGNQLVVVESAAWWRRLFGMVFVAGGLGFATRYLGDNTAFTILGGTLFALFGAYFVFARGTTATFDNDMARVHIEGTGFLRFRSWQLDYTMIRSIEVEYDPGAEGTPIWQLVLITRPGKKIFLGYDQDERQVKWVRAELLSRLDKQLAGATQR